MMKITNTSKRIKEIMAEQGLKQVDILEKAKPFCTEFGIKLTKADLSQYVSGKVEPGQFKLMALAFALNVSELWLMGFDVPRGKWQITNAKHQNFDNEVLSAISVLASYSGYDFNIFANKYQIRGEDYSVALSQSEVEDYAKSSIYQICVVTQNIIRNKLSDNIVSINTDSVLNAAHDNGATTDQKRHADDIMKNPDEWE